MSGEEPAIAIVCMIGDKIWCHAMKKSSILLNLVPTVSRDGSTREFRRFLAPAVPEDGVRVRADPQQRLTNESDEFRSASTTP